MGEHLPCKQGVKSSNLSISISSKFFWEQLSDNKGIRAECIRRRMNELGEKDIRRISVNEENKVFRVDATENTGIKKQYS